jgi:RNA polymerase sigma-70 factor, ECF subfamily
MIVATPESTVRSSLVLDRELIERVQRGEKQAFRELYDRYARIVYRYILLRLRNAQDAEDLTSETFIRAWRAVASFEWRDTSPAAWLLRIAHNLIVDKSRQRKDVLGFLPWRHGKEEIEFDQIQDRDEIQRAFDTLSNEQQMIVYLHFFEGYDLTEVAQVLGKTPNAVTVAQFRALQRMQKVLKHA